MSDTRTVTLQVSGMIRATSKNVTEAHLSRQPGVIAVDANPVSQTATVTYDPETTSVAHLQQWVIDCGYGSAEGLVESKTAPLGRAALKG
ncbi:cation transporter [Gulosibacter sp. ACHW.36C]|uniref:Cation transporter n=1 Tax=Gulosibacter sediminis TaxID=1729695 RepID=A0ABY4MYT0_9MICO|nr:cation transporter [Gulosibacter sediminis]UQN15590.1 cation transporter [Gulosibacter sediminis]